MYWAAGGALVLRRAQERTPACNGPWGQGTELTGSAISAQHTAIDRYVQAAVLLRSNCRTASVPMAASAQATWRGAGPLRRGGEGRLAFVRCLSCANRLEPGAIVTSSLA